MAKKKRVKKIIRSIKIGLPPPRYPKYRWPLETKLTNLRFRPCTDAVLVQLKRMLVPGHSFFVDKGKPNYRKILEAGLGELVYRILGQLAGDGVISQTTVDRMASYEDVCDLFLECCGVEAKMADLWESESKEAASKKKQQKKSAKRERKS